MLNLLSILKAVPLLVPIIDKIIQLIDKIVAVYEMFQVNRIEKHYSNKKKSIEVLAKLKMNAETQELKDSYQARIDVINSKI